MTDNIDRKVPDANLRSTVVSKAESCLKFFLLKPPKKNNSVKNPIFSLNQMVSVSRLGKLNKTVIFFIIRLIMAIFYTMVNTIEAQTE